MSDKKDVEGQRFKILEAIESGRHAKRDQVLMVRLDGHGFSKFTKGLKRPFDERMSNVMIEVTKFLVEETHANHGYTQSDEITLIWKLESPELQEHYFGGRFQKVSSICAAKATKKFNQLLPTYLPEKAIIGGEFDGRAMAFDSQSDAIDVLQWREKDAYKNSISMAAHTFFSFNSLQGINGGDMIEMLKNVRVDFHAFPNYFKFGTHVKRFLVEEELTCTELEKIPEKYRKAGKVKRKKVLAFSFPCKTKHLEFYVNSNQTKYKDVIFAPFLQVHTTFTYDEIDTDWSVQRIISKSIFEVTK